MTAKTLLSTLATAGLAASASTIGASTVYHINIGADLPGNDWEAPNFQTYVGPFDVDGVVGNDTVNDQGRIFNPVVISDSTGSNAAGVTSQIEGYASNNPNDLEGAGNPNGLGDYINNSLTYGGGNEQLTIANLDPTKLYTVEVYGGLDGRTDLQMSLSVNGGAAQAYDADQLFDLGGPLTFNNVSPLASGFTQDGDAVSNYISVNNTLVSGVITTHFVRITEVPEPSSLALLGLGGLLVARRRRD